MLCRCRFLMKFFNLDGCPFRTMSTDFVEGYKAFEELIISCFSVCIQQLSKGSKIYSDLSGDTPSVKTNLKYLQRSQTHTCGISPILKKRSNITYHYSIRAHH